MNEASDWMTRYHNFVRNVKKPLISDAKCERVEVIVLNWKLPEMESKCASHLIRHTDWPYKLTLYDARNQTANFSRMWNKLASQSTCDFVCIMDSDAFVCENWLSRMMKCFSPGYKCLEGLNIARYVEAAPVGLVVPAVSKGGAHTIQEFDHTRKSPPFMTKEQVSGFFFLFRKCVLYDIGGFDEDFYLHGQDSEWMDRMIASQWNIVVRSDVVVEHLVSASIKKAKEDGEVDYDMDIFHTRKVYDRIKSLKKEGKYVSKQL